MSQQNKLVLNKISSSTCSLHKQQLQLYCETCEDAICKICSEKQPHSGILHKIDTIQNAYNRRVEHIKNYIQNQVKTKRQLLMTQIQKIKQKIQQISKISEVIEKDLIVQVEGMNFRLNQQQSSKIIKIQNQMKRLSIQVNNIDDLYYGFNEATKVPERFLLLYKQFKLRLQKIQTFVIQPQINFQVTLPNQLKAMQERLDNLKIQKQKGQFINQVIYQFGKKFLPYVKQKKQQAQRQQINILTNYADLNQKILMKQMEFLKICHFCGLAFNFNNLNGACVMNKGLKFDRVYTNSTIKQEIRGTKRHFWGIPLPQFTKKPTYSNNSQNNKQLYYIGLKRLKFILFLIERYLSLKKTSINQLFNKMDVQQTGLVNKLQFLYVMTKTVGLTQQQANTVFDYIVCQKGVEYNKIKILIQDKQYFQKQHKQDEEDWQKKVSFAPRSKYTSNCKSYLKF